MKASFNIDLVKGENCTCLKNSICDNIFFTSHHNVFSPATKSTMCNELGGGVSKSVVNRNIYIYIYGKKCAWERIRGRREKKL
jgi:hypothetical protein